MEKKEKHILQNPHSGIPTNFYQTYKIQVLKYFSIYYQVFGNEIEIVAFWDNRRNPDYLEL